MTKLVFVLIIIFSTLLWSNTLEKGKAYFKAGDYENAQKEFKVLVDESDENAEAQYWLGRTCFMLRNFEEASDCLEKAVDLDDTNADYHFWYGNALGNEIQSVSVFKQAFMAGDIIDEYERAIELNPKHIGAHIGAAQFYLQAPGIMGGDIEKARKEAITLKELGSKQGDFILINILVKEEKYDDAEKLYDAFDTQFNDSTDNPNFYNNYGYFLLQQKKYDKAIRMFERLVELRPKWANAYDSLGDGLRAAGNLEEALACYEKALQLDPSFEASKKNIERVKKEITKN